MHFDLLRTPFVARPIAALLLAAMLSSCSTLIRYSTKVHVSDPSDSDKMEAYNTFGGTEDVQHNIFKASNRYRFYTLERSKKGYITDYRTIKQEAINPMLAVDGGLVVVGAIMGLTASSTTDDNGHTTYGSGATAGPVVMLYGALGLLFGHKKAFKKKMPLEPMTPIPGQAKDQMFLYIDKVGVKLASGNVDTRNFSGLVNYRNNLTETGEMNEKRRVTDSFKVESMDRIDVSSELNDVLKEVGFIDTTNSMFKMSNNSNLLEAEVTKWGYNHIYGGAFAGAYTFQLESKWTMKDNLSKETIMEKSFTTVSDIIVGNSSNNLYRKGFVNALTKAMVQMMQHDEFPPLMTDKRVKVKSLMEGWSEIAITPGKYTTQKIGVSSKSVATVKTKEGHGSGVFISGDGYLVTNLHVTGQQTEDLEIILSDGVKLKGKVVRSNPVYDLSLVKVEDFKGKPMALSASREIELGSTVFAIGTPEDLELGQTVTRGIVSSKRVFNNVDYIQTDVSINHGNSGGALLNENSELIGVVNAKIVGTGVEGVGFAIPSYYIPEALKLRVQ